MSETTTSTNTSPKIAKVMELARKDPGLRLRSLAHVLDEHALAHAFDRLRKDAAVGVDGITKEEYGRGLAENIRSLHGRMKTARYRHQPIRRVHIPKASGKLRPLGVSCIEDKIVQGALATLLTAIYEPVFLDCSYVATGERGYQIHRHHRDPGTRPVARGRSFASTAPRRRVREPASQREAERCRACCSVGAGCSG